MSSRRVCQNQSHAAATKPPKTLRSSSAKAKPIESGEKVEKAPKNSNEDLSNVNEKLDAELVAKNDHSKNIQSMLEEMLKKQEEQMKEFRDVVVGMKREGDVIDDVEVKNNCKNMKTEQDVQEALIGYLNHQSHQMSDLIVMLKSGESMSAKPKENVSIKEVPHKFEKKYIKPKEDYRTKYEKELDRLSHYERNKKNLEKSIEDVKNEIQYVEGKIRNVSVSDIHETLILDIASGA
ncbi:hypothetical protein QAD02_018395 [Eretmocerus hayati]|uniref:Uncharacterized protein n=1 Tax=Eretmocerus hayati TaxID=131215 RepID=A0ACC2PHU5_9HYME|nr:hypothetical protein QAD02_018395 [Eretmocerus hayati]